MVTIVKFWGLISTVFIIEYNHVDYVYKPSDGYIDMEIFVLYTITIIPCLLCVIGRIYINTYTNRVLLPSYS